MVAIGVRFAGREAKLELNDPTTLKALNLTISPFEA